jgi:hypothetical protein
VIKQPQEVAVMVAQNPRIEEHPDLMALRADSERATARPAAQAVECLSLLTALYLAASPWIVGFDTTFRNLAINDLILGVALAVFALGYGAAYERTHGMAWAAGLLGVWTIIAPWVVSGRVADTGARVSNVIAGALVVLMALATIAQGTMRGSSRVMSRTTLR